MSKILPITPTALRLKRTEAIPASVLEALNSCIEDFFDGTKSCFTQKSLILDIVKFCETDGDEINLLNAKNVIKTKWHDIARTYLAAGWNIEETYNESSDVSYVFTPTKD